VVTAGLSGCSEKTTSPADLPKAMLVERTVKPRQPGEPPPLTMTFEFRLTDLHKYDWKKKALRVQLLAGDDAPVYSVNDLPNPVPEVTLQITLGKSTDSPKVLVSAVWGRSAGGEMSQSEEIRFPEGTDLGRFVTVTGVVNKHISQVTQACGAPGKPVSFDPKKGVDLVTVGYGDEACRIRVWAEESLSGDE